MNGYGTNWIVGLPCSIVCGHCHAGQWCLNVDFANISDEINIGAEMKLIECLALDISEKGDAEADSERERTANHTKNAAEKVAIKTRVQMKL